MKRLLHHHNSRFKTKYQQPKERYTFFISCTAFLLAHSNSWQKYTELYIAINHIVKCSDLPNCRKICSDLPNCTRRAHFERSLQFMVGTILEDHSTFLPAKNTPLKGCMLVNGVIFQSEIVRSALAEFPLSVFRFSLAGLSVQRSPFRQCAVWKITPISFVRSQDWSGLGRRSTWSDLPR